MTENNAALSAEEMLDYRHRALNAAVAARGPMSAAAEIAHSAGVYLGFLLSGVPNAPVGVTVAHEGAPPEVGAGPATAATAVATVAKKAATKRAPPAVTGTAGAPATAPATVAAQPTVVPQPTNMTEAVKAFKELVQSKDAGRGREVAIALLTEFGVAQLSQVPAAKLAEFKSRCETAGGASAAPAATAADPLGGLL